jgi:hypothetical protein
MTTTQPIPTAEPVERRTGPILSASDTLTVIAWHDPTVEQASGALPTDSDNALVWYTPSVGTIGMAMAHRFARHAATGPSCWTVEDIARTFGIGPSPVRVARSLDRLERFGIVRRTGRTVAVRLWLAPLTYRQRCQLPGYLAAAYDAR